ncbi:hypothetical protein HDU91_004269, partial [Kappamyces sp. JEL0680]
KTSFSFTPKTVADHSIQQKFSPLDDARAATGDTDSAPLSLQQPPALSSPLSRPYSPATGTPRVGPPSIQNPKRTADLSTDQYVKKVRGTAQDQQSPDTRKPAFASPLPHSKQSLQIPNTSGPSSIADSDSYSQNPGDPGRAPIFDELDHILHISSEIQQKAISFFKDKQNQVETLCSEKFGFQRQLDSLKREGEQWKKA